MTKLYLADVIIGNLVEGEKFRKRLLKHFQNLGMNGAFKLQDVADAYIALHAENKPADIQQLDRLLLKER